MTNSEKAERYDNLIRESDILQRAISKLKSHHPINVPDHIQAQINENNNRINFLVRELEILLR